MTRHPLVAALLCLAAAAMVPTESAAQTGFALRGGTLGPGVEAAHQVSSLISLRGGVTYLPIKGLEFTLEDENVDVGFTVDARLGSVYLLADFLPLGNWVHLSAGAVYNAVKLDAVGQPLNDYQLEGRTFTTETIGSLAATLEYGTKIAPYLGLGFFNVANGGRIGFTIDGGVIFSGPLSVNLSGTGMLEPTAEQDPVVQRALDGIKIYPVVSLGVVIRP